MKIKRRQNELAYAGAIIAAMIAAFGYLAIAADWAADESIERAVVRWVLIWIPFLILGLLFNIEIDKE